MTDEATQERLFDGFVVENERGRIVTFEIDPEDIAHFKADRELTLVVKGVVTGGSFKQTTGGEWLRTSVVTPKAVRVATGTMEEEIVEFYGLSSEELPFNEVLAAASAQRDQEEEEDEDDEIDEEAKEMLAAYEEQEHVSVTAQGRNIAREFLEQPDPRSK